MHKIPDRLPVRMLDRVVAVMSCVVELMIQLELTFDHRLDEGRLAQAFDRILDAEPVLGCRFVDHPKHPTWERLAEDHRANFRMVEQENAYEEFKHTPLISADGPQVQGCLFRAKDGDRLLIKVGHEVADAGAVKEIAAGLSAIYNRLKDEPDFRPEPNIHGSRSLRQVFRHVPLSAFPGILWNYWRETWRNTHPLATFSLDLADVPFSRPTYLLHHLPGDRVWRMAQYGRNFNATLNDLLVAALFRALIAEGDWDGKAHLRISTTVDTRRYLLSGRSEGICNLSSIEFNFLDRDPGRNFEETLKKIAAYNNWRKAHWIGLNPLVGLSPLMKATSFYRQKKLFKDIIKWALAKRNFADAITNMGPIDPSDVSFDEPPIAAWLLVPPVRPPMLGVGVSGYNGSLTLSAGIYPEGMKQVDMARLYRRIDSELPA